MLPDCIVSTLWELVEMETKKEHSLNELRKAYERWCAISGLWVFIIISLLVVGNFEDIPGGGFRSFVLCSVKESHIHLELPENFSQCK